MRAWGCGRTAPGGAGDGDLRVGMCGPGTRRSGSVRRVVGGTSCASGGSPGIPRLFACFSGGEGVLGRAGKRNPDWGWGERWTGRALGWAAGWLRPAPAPRVRCGVRRGVGRRAARLDLRRGGARGQGCARPGQRAAGEGLISRPRSWGGSGSGGPGGAGREGRRQTRLCGGGGGRGWTSGQARAA